MKIIGECRTWCGTEDLVGGLEILRDKKNSWMSTGQTQTDCATSFACVVTSTLCAHSVCKRGCALWPWNLESLACGILSWTHTRSLFCGPLTQPTSHYLMCWVLLRLILSAFHSRSHVPSNLKRCTAWLPLEGPRGHFPSHIAATSIW